MGGTALCLAGGGSRGIFQASSLKAVSDFGIIPDYLFTSSAGTLNGLLYASNKDYIDAWMTIRNRNVYSKNLLSMLNVFTEKGSIYDSSPLLETIKKYIDIKEIRNFPAEFIINTTDLVNSRTFSLNIKELSDEELPIFAYASASPPIFFPPVKFRGLTLADSGISNNFSLVSAIRAGCDTIIMISPTIIDVKKLRSIIDVIKATLAIATRTYLEREAGAIFKINDIIDVINIQLEPDYKKIKLVIITPEKSLNFDLLDFSYKNVDRAEVIKYGYNLTMEKLKRELLCL